MQPAVAEVVPDEPRKPTRRQLGFYSAEEEQAWQAEYDRQQRIHAHRTAVIARKKRRKAFTRSRLANRKAAS